MRIPLIGGAYAARSNIAACTRAINLYPEINPKEQAVVPMTHYQRPGFQKVSSDPGNQNPVRGIWNRTDSGGAYVVIGSTVYYLSNTYVLTAIGNIATNTGFVSMVDNGVTVMLVDGSPTGYFIDMASNALSVIVDGTGIFQGGTSVDILDTYIVWGFLDSNLYGATLPGSTTFNALYYAAKAAWPDPLVRVFVNKRELLLFGQFRSEIWWNAGGQQFPFQILPGVYLHHGCVAVGSVASQDLDVFWLAQNQQGQGMVMKQRGYETKRVSNHALEYQLRQLYQNGIPISDAVGFTYQSDGHVFYVLSFAAGNQTWVMDCSIGDPQQAWHQWCWTDGNGELQRARCSCGAFLSGAGTFVVGDWQNGNIYVLNPNYYSDDAVAAPGNPITFIRTFPHLSHARPQGSSKWAGDLAASDGRRVKYNAVYADIECGKVPDTSDPEGPQVTLRWSDDRGNSWKNGQMRTMGKQGQYQTWPEWQSIGLSRDMIFELSYNASGPASLNGAWVDAEVLDS